MCIMKILDLVDSMTDLLYLKHETVGPNIDRSNKHTLKLLIIGFIFS
jgi:hypothetical protein